MNLKRVLDLYPGADCRRIDLVIGEKECWGRGVGTAVIRALTAFAFRDQGVEVMYVPDILDFNTRSRRAFERAGYKEVARHVSAAGSKAAFTFDMALSRADYLAADG